MPNRLSPERKTSRANREYFLSNIPKLWWKAFAPNLTYLEFDLNNPSGAKNTPPIKKILKIHKVF